MPCTKSLRVTWFLRNLAAAIAGGSPGHRALELRAGDLDFFGRLKLLDPTLDELEAEYDDWTVRTAEELSDSAARS